MIRITAAVAGAVLVAVATAGLSPARADQVQQQRYRGDPLRGDATGGAGPAWGGCRVRYAATTWNNGFIGDVIIHNTGATAIRGWNLRWAWPGGQQVAGVWNASLTQNGTRVTARNASWNAAIAPGGRVRFGFEGTYGKANGRPTWFALNGTSCAIG